MWGTEIARTGQSGPAAAAGLALTIVSLASCGGSGGGPSGGQGGQGIVAPAQDDLVQEGVADVPFDPDACGDVTIASMNWASAATVAEIDRFVLAEGYGCEAVLVEGDTLPTFTSMRDTGQPDLAPELWTTGIGTPMTEAVEAGLLVEAARTVAQGGLEGWWIPRYVANANPGIRTVADALARPDLFPAPGGSGAGAVHNCPVGWNCEITSANLFRAHEAEARGFVLVDTGSAAGLDSSIERAFELGEGWLGYYWSPTAMLGRRDMVRLDAPAHDPAEWARCTSVRDCPDPVAVDYPRSEIRAVLTSAFAEREGVVLDYLSRRELDDDTINALLAWALDNDAGPAEAARHFLTDFETVWMPWVGAPVATRIGAALAR